MSECAICGTNHNHDNHTICTKCETQTLNQLTTIQQLTEQSLTWDRRRDGNRLFMPPQSTPPVSITILEAQLGYAGLQALEPHERHVRRVLGLIPYGIASNARNKTTEAREALFTCIHFLRSHLRIIVETPAIHVEDLYADSRNFAAALRAIDPNTDHDNATIIRCPADHPDQDGTNCNQRLRITPTNDTIHCHGCNTTWTIDRLVAVARSIPGHQMLANATTIAAWYRVDERTVRRWHHDGYVRKTGELYDVGDVIDHIAAKRA